MPPLKRRMTFLQFCCYQLLDDPRCCPWCDADGDAEWKSFSILPPKKRSNGSWYDIKFRCHRCGKFGDELDLAMKVYGVGVETAKVAVWNLLEQYRREYKLQTTLGELWRNRAVEPRILAQRGLESKRLARVFNRNGRPNTKGGS